MVNSKLAMMNKLLMDENVRLQDQVSHLLHENAYLVIQQQQQQQQQLSLQHVCMPCMIAPKSYLHNLSSNLKLHQIHAFHSQCLLDIVHRPK